KLGTKHRGTTLIQLGISSPTTLSRDNGHVPEHLFTTTKLRPGDNSRTEFTYRFEVCSQSRQTLPDKPFRLLLFYHRF
ncbi:hypothetical protein, partial [Levilactobacillus brevis]|uniref:hypothetical protein n=1 Tax=Levilactobacillus brevis TaxID=1580 RepID=UPI0021A616B8